MAETIDPPATPVPSRTRVALRAYYELTKPGIAAFVMMTAGVAYYVALAGRVSVHPLFLLLLGTLVATAGALALNQYIEREVDARMTRTRLRPLPSGRLSPRQALGFGVLMLAGGSGLLWAAVGPLPAVLTLAAAGAYNLVYTPLKSRSYLATFAGAVPGAMPALIGWGAATGTLALGAWVLFAIAFLWQIPHVLALAWLLRDDYRIAGFRLSPPDPGGRLVGRQMALYSATLLPVSLFPTALGLTGWVYLGGAVVIGSLVLLLSFAAMREMSRAGARRVFLGSLAYQPLLLGLMLVDTVRV